MPPLNIYIFQCISDAQTEIIIRTYGSIEDAFSRLQYHVKDTKNFKLKQNKQWKALN